MEFQKLTNQEESKACQALIFESSITEKSCLHYLVLLLVYSLRLEFPEEVCEVIGVRETVLSTGMVLSLVVNVVPDNGVTRTYNKRRISLVPAEQATVRLGPNSIEKKSTEKPLEKPTEIQF